MTEHGPADDIRIAIDVAAPIDQAFRAFTARFDSIKPRDHNLLGVDIAETVLEPEPGGRVYDRGVDGSTCTWGRVVRIDPPHLLVLAWLIDPMWQVVDDEAQASEVEVRFAAVDEDTTNVTVHHRHLRRHGDGWERVVEPLRGPDGWPRYLDRFRQLFAT